MSKILALPDTVKELEEQTDELFQAAKNAETQELFEEDGASEEATVKEQPKKSLSQPPAKEPKHHRKENSARHKRTKTAGAQDVDEEDGSSEEVAVIPVKQPTKLSQSQPTGKESKPHRKEDLAPVKDNKGASSRHYRASSSSQPLPSSRDKTPNRQASSTSNGEAHEKDSSTSSKEKTPGKKRDGDSLAEYFGRSPSDKVI